MNFSRLITFWPCHSIEDFPTHYRGDDAAEILVCWTVLWHPALIAAADSAPQWKRYDTAEEDWSDSLVSIPIPSRRRMDADRLRKIEMQATRVVSGSCRADLIRSLLPDQDANWKPNALSGDVVDTFYALGYAWLQIQLLTRQLRYSSSLDQVAWNAIVVRAAQAANEGQWETAREQISHAFDLLLEEKNRYYPVTANLVDFVLNTGTTFPMLDEQLKLPQVQNWLFTGSELAATVAQRPDLQHKIKERISAEKLEIIGGLSQETTQVHRHLATVIAEFRAGIQQFESITGKRPTVFGRRTAGLHATLPSILKKLGFQGALHIPFAGEKLPLNSAPLFSWQAPDGTAFPALGSSVLDTSRADCFLKIGVMIGEQIDSYHHATVLLAHWPGQYSEFFQDFCLANRFGGLMGRFRLLSEIFDDFYESGYGDTFDHDDYRTNLLSASVTNKISDPISSSVRYHQAHNQIQKTLNLLCLCEMVSGRLSPQRQPLLELNIDVDRLADSEPLLTPTNSADVSQLTQKITAVHHILEQELAAALGHRVCAMSPENDETRKQAVPLGKDRNLLLLNPHETPLRFSLPISPEGTPRAEFLLVDIPAMGVRWGRLPDAASKANRAPTPLATLNSLRNEFFEVAFDPGTGSIRSVKTHASRAPNILSQQLACRSTTMELEKLSSKTNSSVSTTDVGPPVPQRYQGDTEVYSQMVADSLEIKEISNTEALAISCGRLMVAELHVADFEQTVQITRGSSEIRFSVKVAPKIELPGSAPWNHYFCSRIAWNDEGAKRYREIHNSMFPCVLERFIAPTRIRIDDGSFPFSISPHGLPFHRQSSLRMLDTLLIVRGEREQEFQFSVNIEVEPKSIVYEPRQKPTSMISVIAIEGKIDSEKAPTLESLRLFRIAPQQLKVAQMRSIINDAGIPAGVELVLVEQENSSGPYKVIGPRDWRKAYQVDLQGKFLQDIEIVSGAACGRFHGHQMICLNLEW